ncbi:CopG family transcriptional regulator [Microbacteriaceae bacterium VKM Ac-2855]|nr:CopG family transcriptional regulator [Microbacteriaceae bacterium VKM Ac-2855]
MELNETINGVPVTEDQIETWVAEAECGYDIDELRRRGRPRMGTGVARVTTLRLDPELEAALDERASRDHLSRSDVMRDALRAWLRSA